MKIDVSQLSETHLMIVLGEKIDVSRTPIIAALTASLKEAFPSLIEVVPSYTTIMVEFNPFDVNITAIESFVRRFMSSGQASAFGLGNKCIVLPVYYDPSVAPDLEAVAQYHGLTIDEVIGHHANQCFTVCAIGFAPGFAFLGEVDDVIATPRHAEPRLKVAKGSVGIADTQTAVYPAQSPGGWQIIGNCPVELFDPNEEPMIPFAVGDTVMFRSVSREQFIELGGVI